VAETGRARLFAPYGRVIDRRALCAGHGAKRVGIERKALRSVVVAAKALLEQPQCWTKQSDWRATAEGSATATSG